MSYVYLQHHGIKGQRWGVRRFQNADGSLTSAGKKRYDKMSGTKLHNKLQKQYDKSKGGTFGTAYGDNVSRVQKEQKDKKESVNKRLLSTNKEYARLNNERKTLKKQYDDLDRKFLESIDKGDMLSADKHSLKLDSIEKSYASVDKKMLSIEHKELKKRGMDEVSLYAERSVAALMDLGFNKEAAKSLTDKMLKEDKYGRAVYI